MSSFYTDVLVLGAGISGLSAAFRLHQQQVDLLVADRAERVGGVITTRAQEGFRWEEGPNSFTPSPALLNLIADAGVADRLVWADGKLPRFVYLNGTLTPVPMTPPRSDQVQPAQFWCQAAGVIWRARVWPQSPQRQRGNS